MAWNDKITDWYIRWLGLFLASGGLMEAGMVERVLKFHKRFLKGGLRLVQVVGAYLITYWIYNTEGFSVAVLVVLVGILLAVGRVAENTKPFKE